LIRELRVNEVELPHPLQHPDGTAGDAFRSEIGGDVLLEASAVSGTIFSLLLELYKPSTDHPVSHDERLIRHLRHMG
jgi:hypothetical protein